MKYVVYRVDGEEELNTIARMHGTSSARIMELNRLEQSQTYSGMRLLIECGGGVYHTVLPFETLDKIAKRYGVSAEEIARVNALKQNGIFLGQRLFIPERSSS